MQKIKTILVDDEQNNIDLMEHFMRQYCPEIQVIDSCLTYDSALESLRVNKPDLVFLDIVLDRNTSFDLLTELGSFDFQIVFCTAYDEYAVKAFKYNTIDYLLKPVVIDDLTEAVARSIKRMKSKQPLDLGELRKLSHTLDDNHPSNYLIISSMDDVVFVKPNEVTYLKSSGRYTEIYLLNKKQSLMSSKPIGDYEKFLDPLLFYRIHNSYIINLTHLESIDKKGGNYCKLPGNKLLPISRRRFEGLLQFFKMRE